MLLQISLLHQDSSTNGIIVIQLTTFSVHKVLYLLVSKTFQGILPWQMNKTLIIVIIYSFLPGNDLFCKGSRPFCILLQNNETK